MKNYADLGGVIRRSRRLRRMTPFKICIILHIIRKPNLIIVLLFVLNISRAQKRDKIEVLFEFCNELQRSQRTIFSL